jgi:type II secretory pathway pseudopilin PulG
MSYLRLSHRLPDSSVASPASASNHPAARSSSPPTPPANFSFGSDFTDSEHELADSAHPSRPSWGPIPPRSAAFSMVEMIGVLAIIAILAVVIVPRVFSTIDSSRVTSAASSVTAIKSSISDFAGKYGTMPVTNANSRIDDLLLAAGLTDSRFVVKLGTQPSNPPIAGATWTQTASVWAAAGGASQATQSRIICVTSNVTAPSAANGANYQLDGVTNLPAGSLVVSAVIVNATANQARALSENIDGDAYTAATNAVADNAGKVVYAAPNAAGLTTVYIYLANQ